MGITGGIAAGKSTVTRILSSWGYVCIDADKLARGAVAPGSKVLSAIAREFGRNVLTDQGSLDRKFMRDLVFRDVELRKKLETIVHPEIRRLLAVELQNVDLLANPRLWFYEAALLFETGAYKNFLANCLVTCDRQTQIARVIERDKVSWEDAERIVSSQMPEQEKKKLADVVIENTAGQKELEQTLKTLISHLPEGLIGDMNAEKEKP
ncbi:MAG: dephospho-CoA kinase [Deltaproteobacteria bacterium]|nr:dephospho-CoA kinase [Deltaproteobacteria bacterium]